jgi:hypothetical protein
MKETATNLVVFQQSCDSLILIKSSFTGAATFSVSHQRLLEFVGESEIVNDQPTWFVLEDAIYASDGLH